MQTPSQRDHPFLSSPHRTFFYLSLPVLFSLIAEPLTGLVDTAFISRLGSASLAALGVGAMVLSGDFWIFNFIGAGQVAQARRVAAVVCLWSTAAGFGLTLVMLLGHDLVTAAFVPAAAIAMFTSAWFVAALAQPVSALAFVTDGIHWGTADYSYLHNVITLATISGAVAIIYLDEGRSGALTWIWVITAGWIIVRALFGVLRIWPGIGKSPLTMKLHRVKSK